MKQGLWKGCLLAGLLAMGCGSSGSTNTGFFNSNVQTVTGKTLTITEPNAIKRGDDVVNSLEVEGFDSAGTRVFGPVVVPFSNAMQIAGVPESAAVLQLDYLRNGGFMLYRAEVPADPVYLIDPQEQPVDPQATEFHVVREGDGFTLQRTVTGAASSGPNQTKLPRDMVVKGVCYSPSPINFSNKSAPAVGDLFWDTFTVPGGDTIYNWGSLFLNFYDPNIGQSRADLEKIRALKANTVRLYSAIAYHLNNDGTFPNTSTAQKFTHEAFLDECWKNGQAGALQVIIDIPMPDTCFFLFVRNGRQIREINALKPNGDPTKLDPAALDLAVAAEVARRDLEVAFWEANLEETVRQMKDHPAVMGFNIMNEQDGDRASSPNGGQGPDYDESQYFYAQSKKYSDRVKSIAGTKLCGWAFHDSPAMVNFGSKFPTTGTKYLAQLTSFDYWGVNSYQTQDFEPLTKSGNFGNYTDLKDLTGMYKPILLTELGWPSTTHNADQLVDNDATQSSVADTIDLMFKQVYANKIFLGACYFEFSDEWWKQPGKLDYVHDTGNAQSNFPNGFADEESFGLYSVARDGGRPDQDDVFVTFGDNPHAEFGSKGPKTPFDKLTPKTPMIRALTQVFSNR